MSPSFDCPTGSGTRSRTLRTVATTRDDEESPEDFGIDPESATYKYDTGR